MSVYDAGRTVSEADPRLGTWYFVLLGIGVVNTLISAGYYLRLLRIMALDEPAENSPLGEPAAARWFAAILAIATVLIGIWWTPLVTLTKQF